MIESYGNYIPESDEAKREYSSLMLEKYREFLKEKEK